MRPWSRADDPRNPRSCRIFSRPKSRPTVHRAAALTTLHPPQAPRHLPKSRSPPLPSTSPPAPATPGRRCRRYCRARPCPRGVCPSSPGPPPPLSLPARAPAPARAPCSILEPLACLQGEYRRRQEGVARRSGYVVATSVGGSCRAAWQSSFSASRRSRVKGVHVHRVHTQHRLPREDDLQTP